MASDGDVGAGSARQHVGRMQFPTAPGAWPRRRLDDESPEAISRSCTFVHPRCSWTIRPSPHLAARILTKPHTVRSCQSVAFIISANVPPFARCIIAMISAFLLVCVPPLGLVVAFLAARALRLRSFGRRVANVLGINCVHVSPCRLLRLSHPPLRLREIAGRIFCDYVMEANDRLGMRRFGGAATFLKGRLDSTEIAGRLGGEPNDWGNKSDVADAVPFYGSRQNEVRLRIIASQGRASQFAGARMDYSEACGPSPATV